MPFIRKSATPSVEETAAAPAPVSSESVEDQMKQKHAVIKDLSEKLFKAQGELDSLISLHNRLRRG